MTIVTPNYYKKFKCIASECKHSCCIGWEIDIDDVTLQKYNNLKCDFGARLQSNIDFKESPHFKLDANERCPFLNDKGLCDIITTLGEDMLCQICNDHPRFRNFYSDYEEVGLGLCCEAAAKLILTQKGKVTFNLPPKAAQLTVVRFRQKLFEILQDRSLSIEKRVNNMLKAVDAKFNADNDWYSIFNNLEKLDKSWNNYLLRIKNGISQNSNNNSLDTAYEQLLVYLIFRHFFDCQYDKKIKERVLFAALVYKVIRTMNISNTIDELIDIARAFSCEIEYSDENINKLLLSLSK